MMDTVTNDVEFIRDLEAFKSDQHRSLYKVAGRWVCLSTVGNVGGDCDMGARAIIGLAGTFGGYATGGEETMAFFCDEDGEVIDWGEIASATGEGSREDVLEQLRVASITKDCYRQDPPASTDKENHDG